MRGGAAESQTRLTVTTVDFGADRCHPFGNRIGVIGCQGVLLSSFVAVCLDHLRRRVSGHALATGSKGF
jgi:hypothetical protein